MRGSLEPIVRGETTVSDGGGMGMPPYDCWMPVVTGMTNYQRFLSVCRRLSAAWQEPRVVRSRRESVSREIVSKRTSRSPALTRSRPIVLLLFLGVLRVLSGSDLTSTLGWSPGRGRLGRDRGDVGKAPARRAHHRETGARRAPAKCRYRSRG